MTYITIDMPELQAKEIMQLIDNDIKLPANSPPFFLGIDIGGNIGINSRRIETVIYSAKTPNPNDIGNAIIKIVKSNAKLFSLLGCNTQPLVRKQIQLSNCLGVTQEDAKTAVSESCGFAVSNLHFRAPRHTTHMLQSSEIYTSDTSF